MTIKLHCFGESGNAYKAALTLELAGLEWQPEFVDFFNGETRTPEFRALNPMGEVPVMIDGDITLTQSGVIQDYISSKSGKLGARSAVARRDILRWQFWDNHKLSGVAGGLRFQMNFLPEDKRNAGARSEEHTSELQSRRNLVCRLLLEKKKNRNVLISNQHALS